MIDRNALSQAKYRIIRLLYPIPEGSMTLHRLLDKYKEVYGQECPLSFLTDYMEDIVTVSILFVILNCFSFHFWKVIRNMKQIDYVCDPQMFELLSTFCVFVLAAKFENRPGCCSCAFLIFVLCNPSVMT